MCLAQPKFLTIRLLLLLLITYFPSMMAEGSSSLSLGHSSNRQMSLIRSHKSEDEESTPLLSSSVSIPRYDGEDEQDSPSIQSLAATSFRSLRDDQSYFKPAKSSVRWPTILAISVLGASMVAIIASTFFVPAIFEEYVKRSLVLELQSLSIESIESTGVTARVYAHFKLDALRVTDDIVRNIGRAGTWIARKIESKPAKAEVYLPEYGNILIGTAMIPAVMVDIRNGYVTHLNFSVTLSPGDLSRVRSVINDWWAGQLGTLRVQGKMDIALKSGLISLGTKSISEYFVFEGSDIPTIPQYNTTRLNFREVQIPPSRRGMAVDVSLSVINDYPIGLEIPSLGFNILVPNCASNEPFLVVADATTDIVVVNPYSDIKLNVGGIVRQLDDTLVTNCPNLDRSPLDVLLGGYIHGQSTKVFVRGSNIPGSDTPGWIKKLLSSVTIPVDFPGHSFENLVRNFSLAQVHFELPDPNAEPGTPESNPLVSGNIEVVASLPKEMNFGINVSHVRATADVFYEGNKLGVINVRKWQPASSLRLLEMKPSFLKIMSRIRAAPLTITDENVFNGVVRALFIGGNPVVLKVKALVDVKIRTVLGDLRIRDLPGEGDVPVKPISKDGLSNLKPQVGDLKILNTSKTSLSLEAKVNFTNPTEYAAYVPYVDIHILHNGSIIGQGRIRNLEMGRGKNTNILIDAVWDPCTLGGQKAKLIGRDLLSQYISGWNTSLTFKTHKGSIPSQPGLGEALSKFEVQIPTPRLSTPNNGGKDDDEENNDGPQFIKDAIFHLFSSTATFHLVSPFQHSDIYIENINATALYNHKEPIGTILYDLPFRVPPGISQTPRLPVDWTFDSVGYEKVRKALGGKLKLDARGNVVVRLGYWSEEVWYIGAGIGAKVSF